MSDPILDCVLALNVTLQPLSNRDRLHVLQIEWQYFASAARAEAMIRPGGFYEERARQVEQLRNMADLVETDEPEIDVEM